MSEPIKNEWTPIDVSHPGDTLLETIEFIGMSQAELALRLGRPKKTVNEIIKGKAAVTDDTARQLEHVLGISAAFWLALQRNHDASRARRIENDQLRREKAWLKEIPYATMVKRGWLPKRTDVADSMRDALAFYGCGTVKGFRDHYAAVPANFRRSKAFEVDPLAVASWLRRCEQVAKERRSTDPFDAARVRALLPALRACTRQPILEGLETAREKLTGAGVALVWAEPLPKSRLSGAAFAQADRRVVALTLRHGSDDHVWFTVFHELGHLLLHEGRGAFVDDGRSEGDALEQQADAFARETLLPPGERRALEERPRIVERDVAEFAEAVGVAPGIVVGALQHERRLPRAGLNELKRWCAWVEGRAVGKG